MEKTAIVAGLMITVMGLIGIPRNGEAIAIAGAIVFGAGLISRAIGRKT